MDLHRKITSSSPDKNDSSITLPFFKNVPLNKSCKSNYGEGLDACSEMVPFCCPANTLAAWNCRINLEQCSQVGKEKTKYPLFSPSKIPPNRIRKPEVKLTDQQKDRYNYDMIKKGAELRKKTISSIASKAQGCNKRTLESLGAFGADNIKIFYEHELHIDPKYIRDLKITTLCNAMNSAIAAHEKRIEANKIFIPLHRFLKNNIMTYLLKEIEYEEQQDIIPMDISADDKL